jgi:phosphatidylserine/phosphatidylglycerophosphate/cardiolipin synthase-like enzyme
VRWPGSQSCRVDRGAGILRIIAIVAVASAENAQARESLDKVDVVRTAPVQFAVPVRATFATMVEMVQEARGEIVIVGSIFTAGASEFVRRVSQARQRGLAVTIIGNRMRQCISELRELWGPGRAPAVYGWEGDGADEMASLHAKLLICDKETALVTSANYSLHGLHENIEIGLRVRSPSVARLNDFVRQLIASATVAPVSWN